MLWYQFGCRAAPLLDATISQASSPSGKRAIGVTRFSPDLAPTVVRYTRSMPRNRSPLRRCTLIIIRVTNRVNAFPFDGTRAPRVPRGGLSIVTGRTYARDVPTGRRDAAPMRPGQRRVHAP